MTPQDLIFRDLALYLTYALIGVKFTFSIYYFQRYYFSETKNKLILGFALVFLCLGVSRIFYTIFDFYLTNFDPLFYQMHINVWKLAALFSELGIGILIIISEQKIFGGRDKYIFFILYLIFLTFGMLWPEFVMAENFSSWAAMFAAFILFSYIYLAITLEEGDARTRAILVVIGTLLYVAGSAMLHLYFVQAVVSLGGSSLMMAFISPIVKICASVFFAFGFQKG